MAEAVVEKLEKVKKNARAQESDSDSDTWDFFNSTELITMV